MARDAIYRAAVIFGDGADRAIKVWPKAKTPILYTLCFAAGAIIATKLKD